MGQDTYVKFGVAVILELTFENIKLIALLLQNHTKEYDEFGIQCYVYEQYDEVGCFEDSHISMDLIHKLSEAYDNAEFNKSHNLKATSLVFFVKCASAYARNISRRYHSHIFGQQECESVENMCDKLTKAKQLFVSLGVSDHLISTGYTIYDSY